ncbi:phosphopentomutase [Desulforudis sp. DRI-14]|uniref:phosphopentomutase n=1 Tax=Desulforudis sp. DRI-14 TaxID=3459793 RepID=UPI004041531B
MNRVIVIVLDSVGIGWLPDAAAYGDEGSNTLCNIACQVGRLRLPTLGALGLGNIAPIQGVPPAEEPLAAWGKMAEKSAGKDTTTGHWELAGLILDKPFPVYPQGFPGEIIEEFSRRIGRSVLGNKPASGTAIIEELGAEHMRTGALIVYTSADSVFQVAAHEDVVSVEELYRICETARELLRGEHAVGRVIARPFTGEPGSFRRTERRHDYALPPVGPTVLDALKDAGQHVVAIGKVKDIFAERGITAHLPARNNADGVDAIHRALDGFPTGLIFANLVDFDMLYGHRNDACGYAAALEAFDGALPRILAHLAAQDLLVITADHGCDPTTSSTDHSREYVPVLAYHPGTRGNRPLGTRESFADMAATAAEVFGIPWGTGRSFLQETLAGRDAR